MQKRPKARRTRGWLATATDNELIAKIAAVDHQLEKHVDDGKFNEANAIAAIEWMLCRSELEQRGYQETETCWSKS
jgi:hypothetical protein